jgi:hypothetical protein
MYQIELTDEENDTRKLGLSSNLNNDRNESSDRDQPRTNDNPYSKQS